MGHTLFWSVVAAQGLIGAGTTWCAALLAREMFGGEAAVYAAAAVAVYPYYVIHDTALQETSLFTLLTLLSVLVLRRATGPGSAIMAAGGGALLALAVLTRATIAPFAALAPIWLAWRTSGSATTKLRRGVLCALALTAVLAPWLWRSYKLTGEPALSTEVGLQVWNGNNPFLFRHYPTESSDLGQSEAFDALSAEEKLGLVQIGDNEALRDRWFLDKGLTYMQAHPWLTLVNGVRKIGAAFGLLPSPRRGLWPNLIHACSYGPVMLLGALGMWRHRSDWRDDCLIYSLFGVFALVTAVFFAHTSHRAYLDVYLIVFAAGTVAAAAAPAYPPALARSAPPFNAARERFKP